MILNGGTEDEPGVVAASNDSRIEHQLFERIERNVARRCSVRRTYDSRLGRGDSADDQGDRHGSPENIGDSEHGQKARGW